MRPICWMFPFLIHRASPSRLKPFGLLRELTVGIGTIFILAFTQCNMCWDNKIFARWNCRAQKFAQTKVVSYFAAFSLNEQRLIISICCMAFVSCVVRQWLLVTRSWCQFSYSWPGRPLDANHFANKSCNISVWRVIYILCTTMSYPSLLSKVVWWLFSRYPKGMLHVIQMEVIITREVSAILLKFVRNRFELELIIILIERQQHHIC